MKTIITPIFVLISLIAFGQNNAIGDLWKLYSSRDFESVIEKAKPLLNNEPNNAELNLIIGRSYADKADYQNAVPYLESTVKNDKDNSWQKAWAYTYLGTCYFMLQKYAEAEKSLNECIRLNATKNATNDAYGKSLRLGYNEFFNSWKIVETEHFRFHFQKMDDEDIAIYTSVREKAFTKINGFFNSALPKKIDFFVWESREDAKSVLKANLGFAKPEFCVVHSHYLQTKGHEMTHVISNYSTTMLAKTELINEGTAVCFDQSTQDKEQIVKGWLKANSKKVAIKEIWSNWGAFPTELTYPLSGLFVKALIEKFGQEKFMAFFGDQSYEHAKAVFGNELDTLISKFEEKINS
ncbi:tetratricopeptide repeat protein [Maribellus sp. YY47]|uniref:tetratricopeptide repeat protein n=1 Tax=Maribellus sp. YY47 TaxID=2929486 RepID=UPI002494AA79|nr:tetratricopeptide repeat protein [Maribellus sp. YY47]